MGVVITKEDLIAYAEVDYIIKHMNERYVAKVPKNLLVFFDTVKDPNHEIYIDPHKPLQSQGLRKYTLEIIALLHVKYWCQNEERKQELIEKMRKNQERFEAQLREQFSTDNLFNNHKDEIVEEDPILQAYGKYMTQHQTNNEITKEEKKIVKTENEISTKQDEKTEVKEQSKEITNIIEEKVTLFSKIKGFVNKIFGKST